MHSLFRICSCLALLLGLAANQASAQRSPEATPTTRVYVLDGGTLTVPNANLLSNADGLPSDLYTDLPVPAFLIVHRDSMLLLDAGLPTSHAALPTSSAPPLRQQIRALGIDPDGISALALSHLHFDHAGQAADFPQARLVVGTADYQAFDDGEAADFDPSLIAPWAPDGPSEANLQRLRGEVDFYGDGVVRFLSTPGHTPGHYMVRVELPEAGPIYISGDLYHTRFSRAYGLISDFDAVPAQSMASQERAERMLALDGARLIIMHDPADYARLPSPPEYLR